MKGQEKDRPQAARKIKEQESHYSKDTGQEFPRQWKSAKAALCFTKDEA